ncbi:NHL domain-containing protein [Urbifossiella limnaea]|uniref:Serine/threonine-protein kinase PknD n=1 Tax=Urbifossiella limnaea TaxID=2528023 RepID=A0A517XZ08_9BACT|nr:SMP-30/gluconolactonase/LRE family protein [Urbifossiella limnaea]QDU22745.1 Serine/threonine-protein kinase PknD [Urbifossiella limnaea]
MLTTLVTALALAQPPTITAAAGTGEKGFAGDGGPATKAKLDQPFDVAFDRAGHLYFSDTFNHRIRKVDAKTGVITTVAGCGKKSYHGDGGPATAAGLNEPYGVELDADSNLYIVDRLNFVVRRVDGKTGVITTVAGNGKAAYGGDGGPATQAGLKEPNGICLDGKGKLYIADVADHRVRVVDLKTGIITTLCGTGKGARAGDGGPFKEASLLGPRAVAIGPDGKLYVVERNGNCVRRIDLTTGTIERFAGTGVRGYTGDGAAALDATFDGPKEIDIDKAGNVYVVDTENEAIRRIDAKTRVVTTVAGRGRTKTPGQGDGGPATAATLGRPHGVAVGPDGGLYIGDTNAHRIRVVR